MLALEVKRHLLWKPARVQIGIFLHLDADATVNLWLTLICHCDLEEDNRDRKDAAECCFDLTTYVVIATAVAWSL